MSIIFEAFFFLTLIKTQIRRIVKEFQLKTSLMLNIFLPGNSRIYMNLEFRTILYTSGARGSVVVKALGY
jgi:hypothetical protein